MLRTLYFSFASPTLPLIINIVIFIVIDDIVVVDVAALRLDIRLYISTLRLAVKRGFAVAAFSIFDLGIIVTFSCNKIIALCIFYTLILNA